MTNERHSGRPRFQAGHRTSRSVALALMTSLPPLAARAASVDAPASNIAAADPRSAIAPALPAPFVATDSPPVVFLEAARTALNAGRTGETQEALERAEARLLSRTVDQADADRPGTRRAVYDIGAARRRGRWRCATAPAPLGQSTTRSWPLTSRSRLSGPPRSPLPHPGWSPIHPHRRVRRPSRMRSCRVTGTFAERPTSGFHQKRACAGSRIGLLSRAGRLVDVGAGPLRGELMAASRDRSDEDDPRPVLSLRPRWRPYVGPALVLMVLVCLLSGTTWSLRRPPSPALRSVPVAGATAGAVLPAPAAKFPGNGYTVVNLKRGVARDASLTLQTAGVHASAHWIIVIRRWSDAAWVATVYLDASSVMTIFLPADDYEISAATGEVWRGDRALCGEATRPEVSYAGASRADWRGRAEAGAPAPSG